MKMLISVNKTDHERLKPPACIRFSMGRIGSNLHEFYGIAVRVLNPVLPVVVQPHRRSAANRQTTRFQILECCGHIVNEQAEVVISKWSRVVFSLPSWEEFYEMAGSDLKIHNPR